ncbi:MAG: orotidine 5'-phosphate decarboxylase [Verrucomicrobia bacterium]|nr:orotidine 5'-phosphate decarboxylase [Verrucomicrobiota bacterium]
MKTYLQLALDVGESADLFALADRVKAWVDWIELGTPLIKRYGIGVVAQARNAFPKHRILADMKTTDAARLEADMAFEAGADIFTVLAAASDATVREAVEGARHHGKQVVVDLIGQPDPIARAQQLIGLKPDYFNLHRSTDARRDGAELRLDLIREFKSRIPAPLSVAGGIDHQNIRAVHEAGAVVVVVGSAITSAKNPERVARAMKEAIQ